MTESPLKDLAVAMAGLESPEEAEAFLKDLCTPTELRAISERWHVARLLARGDKTYRQIHDETGVSTTTITRVARFLNAEENRGYRAMIDRLEGEKA